MARINTLRNAMADKEGPSKYERIRPRISLGLATDYREAERDPKCQDASVDSHVGAPPPNGLAFSCTAR